MKNSKWDTTSYDDKPCYVVLFCSRNKDNAHIEGFKERRKSFVTNKTPNELEREFVHFINDGVMDEMSRFYYSVNERDMKKAKRELMHFLIDDDEFNLCSLQSKFAGICAKKENAKTKKWMFDFDIDNKKAIEEFLEDINKCITEKIEVTVKKTPHGYAIITEHGFDTRELQLDSKWKDVTLKRDDLICVDWGWKDE